MGSPVLKPAAECVTKPQYVGSRWQAVQGAGRYVKDWCRRSDVLGPAQVVDSRDGQFLDVQTHFGLVGGTTHRKSQFELACPDVRLKAFVSLNGVPPIAGQNIQKTFPGRIVSSREKGERV